MPITLKTPGNEIDTRHLGMTGTNVLRRRWRADGTVYSVGTIAEAFCHAFEKWSFGSLAVRGRILTGGEDKRPLRVLHLSPDALDAGYEAPEAILNENIMVVLCATEKTGAVSVVFLCNHMVMDATGLRFFLRDVGAHLTGRAKEGVSRPNPVEDWAALWSKAATGGAGGEDLAQLRSALATTAEQNSKPGFTPSPLLPNIDPEATLHKASCTIAIPTSVSEFELEAVCYKALAEVTGQGRYNYLTYDACRRPVFGQKSHIFAAAGQYLAVPVVGADATLAVDAIAAERKRFNDEMSDLALSLMAREFLLEDGPSECFTLPYVIFNIRGRPFSGLADFEALPFTASWCGYSCALNISLWQGEGEAQLSITRGTGIEQSLPKAIFSRFKDLVEQ